MSMERGTLFTCDRGGCDKFAMVGNEWAVDTTIPEGWILVQKNASYQENPSSFCSDDCLYLYLRDFNIPFGEKITDQ